MIINTNGVVVRPLTWKIRKKVQKTYGKKEYIIARNSNADGLFGTETSKYATPLHVSLHFKQKGVDGVKNDMKRKMVRRWMVEEKSFALDIVGEGWGGGGGLEWSISLQSAVPGNMNEIAGLLVYLKIAKGVYL